MTPGTTTTRRPAAARAGPGRPRGAPPNVRRRRAVAVLLILLALLGGAYLIFRDNLQEALREVTLPLRHDDIIRQQARAKDLDPALVAAIIYEESRFRPRRSRAGAEGLMQILPGTAHFIADRSGGTQFELRDLDTPQVNISYGTWYLRYLLDQYDGNETLAVAAYNAGESRVNEWVAEAGGPEAFDSDAHIPFAETRAYVENVDRSRREYRRHYADDLGL